jgi:hypothetical protein
MSVCRRGVVLLHLPELVAVADDRDAGAEHGPKLSQDRRVDRVSLAGERQPLSRGRVDAGIARITGGRPGGSRAAPASPEAGLTPAGSKTGAGTPKVYTERPISS